MTTLEEFLQYYELSRTVAITSPVQWTLLTLPEPFPIRYLFVPGLKNRLFNDARFDLSQLDHIYGVEELCQAHREMWIYFERADRSCMLDDSARACLDLLRDEFEKFKNH